MFPIFELSTKAAFDTLRLKDSARKFPTNRAVSNVVGAEWGRSELPHASMFRQIADICSSTKEKGTKSEKKKMKRRVGAKETERRRKEKRENSLEPHLHQPH